MLARDTAALHPGRRRCVGRGAQGGRATDPRPGKALRSERCGRCARPGRQGGGCLLYTSDAADDM
eukprot:14240100-Alexandrium_andersonii.AAC.1